MTVAQLQSDGTIRNLGSRSEVVRLGAGIEQTGRLADDRIEAALITLRQFAIDARRLGATRLLAVATEATRVTANGAEFMARVHEELGINVIAIDGTREAELSFRGLTTMVDVGGEVVVADIGGGSTELIYARDGALVRTGSVAVGSGRLTDRFVVADPPAAAELIASQDQARAALRPLADRLDVPPATPIRLILVGGTGDYLGRLVPNRDALTAADVEAVLGRLQRLPAAALAADLHIPVARARVLPAGVAIVNALIELTAPNAISVAQSGLRAGLLLEAFAEAQSGPTEDAQG
jgi:exopolyphosphatase/guanosine-5'-triphosphate,3'-diphosphate pyrophosphatase